MQTDFLKMLLRRRWQILVILAVSVGCQLAFLRSRSSSYEVDSILRLHTQSVPSIRAGGVEGIALFEPISFTSLHHLTLDPHFTEAVRHRIDVSDPALAQSWEGWFELSQLEGSGDQFLRCRVRGIDEAQSATVLEATVSALVELAESHLEVDIRKGRTRLSEEVDSKDAELQAQKRAIRELRVLAQLPPESTGVHADRSALLQSLVAIEARQLEVEIDGKIVAATRLAQIAESELPLGSPIEPGQWLPLLSGTPAMELIERVATRAIEAELDLIRMTSTLAPEHPDLRAGKTRLAAEERAFQALFDRETLLGKHLFAILGRPADHSNADRLDWIARQVGFEQRQVSLAALHSKVSQALASLNAHEAEILELEADFSARREGWSKLNENLGDLELLLRLAPAVLEVFRPPGSATPVNPAVENYGLVAILSGLLLALGVACVLEHLDPRIHSATALCHQGDFPCLAVIPWLSSRQHESLDAGDRGVGQETFHALMNQLFARLGSRRVLMISGSEDGAGTSFVAEQVARAAARLGMRTLLVDANLSSPTVHSRLGACSGPGLADWIEDCSCDPSDEPSTAFWGGENELRLRPEPRTDPLSRREPGPPVRPCGTSGDRRSPHALGPPVDRHGRQRARAPRFYARLAKNGSFPGRGSQELRARRTRHTLHCLRGR